MKIIITRHGETEENREKILQGHMHGILSDLGLEQARKLGERLKDEKIDLIISSDLNRALDTAKAIGKFHPDVKIILDERLREMDFKSLQGKSKEELGMSSDHDFWTFIEGLDVEKVSSISSRAESIVNDISEKNEKNILLVGHCIICSAVISSLMNKEANDLKKMDPLKNTSVSIFEKENGNMELKLLNCARHLDED